MKIAGTIYLKEKNCPSFKNHTPQPRGYVQWHAWAEEKAKTHYQIRCPECGFFAIWVKKNKVQI
jgi:hypothetical protein